MTTTTRRSVLAIFAFALAFLAVAPQANAYSYNNPPSATNAVTTANSRCTGPVIGNLGFASGAGVPTWSTAAWYYLDPSSLPANYNNGSYCIDAERTIYQDDNNNLTAGALLAFGNNTWEIYYYLHSGSGVTSAVNTYSLTYTAGTPTASLSASPTSVNSGSSSLLTWSSTNATTCTGTNFSTGNATAGSVSVTPSSATTYTVTCTGAGGSATDSKTVTVTAIAPPTVSFTATPSSVASGGAVTLTWSSTNADYCTSSQFDTEGATSGSKTANPTTTTTYTVSCTGATGTGTGTWQHTASDVTDMSCPWTDHNRPYPLMSECSSTPPTGSCTNPPDRKCKINSGICSYATTDIYTCVVSGPPPTVSASQTVTVPASVTANLTANPSNTAGGPTTLTWSSTNASRCVGAGGDDANSVFTTGNATSGSVSVSPKTGITYSVTCYSSNYSAPSGGACQGPQYGTYNPTCNADAERKDIECADGYKVKFSSGRYCGTIGNFTGYQGFTEKAECVVDTSCGAQTGGTGSSATATANVAVLTASCSASPQTATVGQTVTWSVTASGGTAPYYYTWTGTDGLSGTGTTATKAYPSSGTKTALVAVIDSSTNGSSGGGTWTAISYPGEEICSGQNGLEYSPLCGTAPSGSCTPGVDQKCYIVQPNDTSEPGTNDYCHLPAVTFGNVTEYRCLSGTGMVPMKQQLADAVRGIAESTQAWFANLIPAAHALMTSCAGLGFTATGGSDCAENAGDSGTTTNPSGGTGNYIIVACDADSNPTDGTVTVTGPAVSCNVSPTTVAAGGSATYTATPSGGASGPYTWTPTGGASCPAGTGSTKTCSFPAMGNYQMTVTATGSGSPSATCPIVTTSAAPIAYITATPDRVNSGGSSTLSFSAANIATTCIVTGPSGVTVWGPTTPAGGILATTTAVASNITKQSTYTISCDSASASDTVIVNIVPRFEEF